MLVAGEVQLVTLEIVGADTDTVAGATAYPPDGGAAVVLAPLLDAPPDRSRWGANLTPTIPGEWVVEWIVTGSGAGRVVDVLPIAPARATAPDGRTYASTTQLAQWLDAAPPEGAHRLLLRATERVDELLRTAVYEVAGDDELPVDPVIAAALRDATCAQAAWFADTDDDGSGAVLRYGKVKIGTVELSDRGGAGAGGDPDQADPRYAPAAIRALRAAGLWNRAPVVRW